MMKQIRDERVVQLTNQILSEAYFVISLFLLGSIAVKAYVLGQPFTQYITEIGVILISAVYIAVRSMLTGNALLDTSRRNKILAVSAILGLSLAATVHNGVKHYAAYGARYSGVLDAHFLAALAVTFLSSAALISAAFFLIYLCHRGGQRKIEKEIASGDEE